MSKSHLMTGQVSSWRDCRQVTCTQSPRQGTGKRALLSSIDPKIHSFGSLKSGLLSHQWHYVITVSLKQRQVFQKMTTPLLPDIGGHSASDCMTLDSLIEVPLDHTDCANSESKPVWIPHGWGPSCQGGFSIPPSSMKGERLRFPCLPFLHGGFLIYPLSEGVPALRRGEAVSSCTWLCSFLFLVYKITHLIFDGNMVSYIWWKNFL